jgi:hypothetical protein
MQRFVFRCSVFRHDMLIGCGNVNRAFMNEATSVYRRHNYVHFVETTPLQRWWQHCSCRMHQP